MANYEKMTPPDEFAKSRLRRVLLFSNPICEAYLGYMGNTPGGLLHVSNGYSTFNARPTLNVEDIFVTENMRGSGLGKALFDYAKSIAKDRQCCRMEWRVLDWNSNAISFYEKMGAKPLKDWTTYTLDL